jgi:KAP family P-loop domain
MDSGSINSHIKEKYGEGSDVIKGSDYLQKIIQLPFKVPTWKEKEHIQLYRKNNIKRA